ncbi:MAG: DUF2939 domain-containing protein [Deltaproteobacteria bacterium]|nr:DUF2939 domain-containing protein [Deltaproteobacteria bacterium]
MRRGFVAAASAGAVLSVAAGLFAAVLPSTPSWALWRLKAAIDDKDTDQVSRMVDIAAVTQRAVDELDGRDGMDLGQLAAVVLGGGKVTTVFTDPDHPLEITGGDVFAAWWGMRRDGDLAYVTLPTGGRDVDLILGNQPARGWRIVGITPITALLRVQPRERGKAPATATAPVSRNVDAHHDEG